MFTKHKKDLDKAFARIAALERQVELLKRTKPLTMITEADIERVVLFADHTEGTIVSLGEPTTIKTITSPGFKDVRKVTIAIIKYNKMRPHIELIERYADGKAYIFGHVNNEAPDIIGFLS